VTGLRDRIAVAMSGTEGHFGDKLDAVMAAVGHIEQERDALLQAVKAQEVDRVQRHLYERRLRLAWLSARNRAVRFRVERDQLRSAQSAWDQRLSDLRAEYLKREQSWDRTRERLTADVDMHMRHRMEVEQILNVELGTEVEDGADAGFVADVALAFQRRRGELDATQGERDELAAQRDEWLSEFDKVRASAVALPEDAEELLTTALADKASAIVTMDDAGPEFDAQYAAIVALDLVRSWRPATVDAAPPTLAETRTGTDWCPNCREEVGTDRCRDDGGTERCATCGSELTELAAVGGTEASDAQ
jgi:hypothetical protein